MESFPKRGMYYEQARSKARRFAKDGNFVVVNSLLTQVKAHDGDKAVRELTKEISHDFKKKMKE